MSVRSTNLIRQKSILQRVFSALFVTLILCPLPWVQSVAQGSLRGKFLGLYCNTGIYSYREDLLVPLGFHGPGFSLGGIYTHRSDISSINVRLKLGMGLLENRYSHNAWAAIMEIRTSWITKLADYQRYGEFWGGFSVPLQMNNLFFESWDESHLYWLTAHSLAVAAEWKKQISPKYDAVFRMEFPLFGWVSRPPTYRYNKQDALTHIGFHFTEPNKLLHFETIDDYRSLFIQMLFKRETPQSILNLGLEFQHIYFREPEIIRGFNTSISISYQWRIGS